MGSERVVEGKGLYGWLDRRFPVTPLLKNHLAEYYAPKNFNFWYFFGSLATVILALQIFTGIFLVMHYKPDASLNAAGIPVAFASVEYIMREVPFGWLIRYMHSTGASAFFVVIYLHMFRGLIYGSYREPRELVWIFGCLIFLSLMAEAFFGYLLPWGQMSFWGAQVIVNLFSAIPLIGPDLAVWIRGDFVVGDATLNRFFAFHVIAIPFVLVGLVAAHIVALHEVGSNNPDGVDIKKHKDSKGVPLDGIPFHPYYTIHDILGLSVFMIIFAGVVFFAPELGGYFLEYNNFIPADPLVTPSHIAPVWYFTPYYSMLRAVTDVFTWALVAGAGAFAVMIVFSRLSLFVKASGLIFALALAVMFRTFDAKFWGVAIMGGAVMILFLLPWLDRSPVRSIRFRPQWHKALYGIFVINFFVLGYLGILPPTDVGTLVSQIGTIYYFLFFMAMPFWTPLGSFKEVPERVVFSPH
ncbi:MAG: cytochrome b [Betaproteobacteria bacterium TMED82]|nr:MAG: cytochrome b [Betaproteobacteria bacterium TMED82]|tara:strand:+ start:573 stop:1976 length:1404 start_codon:yes stop_codon:yes gene_type:complete